MGELFLHAEVSAMAAAGRTTQDDVQLLRKTVFKDGVVSRAEAEMLFGLDRATKKKVPAWTDFFIEAITDYLINVEEPKGYISQDNAKWLIRAISIDGEVDAETEIQLLLNVMDRATSMPAELSSFALRQVERAIVKGKGPLAAARHATKGIVTAHDVEMIKRVLYAFGGDQALGVSRAEAEVLFDINDKTIHAANDPAWSQLFSRAIAFSLMGAMGHQPESRERAVARAEWLDDVSVDIGSFMSGMFAGSLREYGERLRSKACTETACRARNTQREAARQRSEKIDEEEAAWLMERIGRDGNLCDNERRLVAFLRDESPDIHPVLEPLLAKAS